MKSATRFNRDVEYVQAELDRAVEELGDKGAYIGEWHSHLEPTPEPSPTDVRYLRGIPAAPNYLTSTSVLLIAGFAPDPGKVVTIRSWVFVAGGRFYRLPDVLNAA